MALKYRVKELSIAQYPNLVTQIKGKSISLNGKDQSYKRTLSPGSPAVEWVAKVATQAELKQLFEAGNPHIEEYEDKTAEPITAATK